MLSEDALVSCVEGPALLFPFPAAHSAGGSTRSVGIAGRSARNSAWLGDGRSSWRGTHQAGEALSRAGP